MKEIGEGVLKVAMAFFLLCAIHAKEEVKLPLHPVPLGPTPQTLSLIQESVRLLRRRARAERSELPEVPPKFYTRAFA
jgi:hypothetical protein